MASLESNGERLVNSKFEGSARNLIFSAICAFAGPFCFGFTIGYSSPAIPDMESAGLLDKQSATWFGSLMTVGAMFGGPVAGLLIERLGRKRSIQLTSLPFAFGYLFIICADKRLVFFMLGRLLVGFGSGMITVCAPVYIAEIASKNLRGALGSGVQLSITIGILVAYASGLHLGYRGLAAVGFVASVMISIGMIFAPETPRFLLMKNQKPLALKALAHLRGEYADVQDECRDLEDAIAPQTSMSWRDFAKPELYRPLQIAIGLMVFQQCSGINAIMFYTVSIFKSAGFQESGGMASVIIGAVQVVATAMALLVVDRVGRRLLLLLAGVTMTVTCLTFGWYYYKVGVGGEGYNSLGWLAITSLVVYMIGFSFGWGPIPMVLTSEIFPSQARGTACGISIFVNWFCGFIVTKEFVTLQDILGPAGAFWVFAGFCFLGVVFVWRLVPETKGKSLEDIELYFLGRTLIRDSDTINPFTMNRCVSDCKGTKGWLVK